MKITMYELLGLVKDGEVPKRIIYDQFVYVWNSKIENYQREVDEITTLNWDYIAINCLNEPVEILDNLEEEKKIPEKLEIYTITDKTISGIRKSLNTIINKDIIRKINEIIDYLKSKGDE